MALPIVLELTEEELFTLNDVTDFQEPELVEWLIAICKNAIRDEALRRIQDQSREAENLARREAEAAVAELWPEPVKAEVVEQEIQEQKEAELVGIVDLSEEPAEKTPTKLVGVIDLEA